MIAAERKPKGTAAAVIIILRQNPKMSPKQLATMLNLTERRIQQVLHDFTDFLRSR